MSVVHKILSRGNAALKPPPKPDPKPEPAKPAARQPVTQAVSVAPPPAAGLDAELDAIEAMLDAQDKEHKAIRKIMQDIEHQMDAFDKRL